MRLSYEIHTFLRVFKNTQKPFIANMNVVLYIIRTGFRFQVSFENALVVKRIFSHEIEYRKRNDFNETRYKHVE